MSAPRLGSLRPAGGPAPAAHFFRLVWNASLGLPTTSQAGAAWAARSLFAAAKTARLENTTHQKCRQLAISVRSSTSRTYGATAYAVVEPESEPHLDPSNIAQTPSSDLSSSPAPDSGPYVPVVHPPEWTMPSSSVRDILYKPDLNPSDFRAAFESANSQPYHLARITTLQRIWTSWIAHAEPSSWAWLAGQLGNTLAMIPAEIAELESGLVPMIQSIRAYAILQVGQESEARAGLANIRRSKTRGGLHAALIQTKAWLEMGDWAAANRHFGLGARYMASQETRDGRAVKMAEDLVGMYAEAERWEDLLDVVLDAGGSLRTLVLSTSAGRPLSGGDERVIQLWLDALAEVPDPAGWLSNRLSNGGGNKDVRWMGTLFVSALIRNSTNLDKADSVITYLISERLPFPPALASKALSTMSSAGHTDGASRIVNHLSAELDRLPHSALSSLLEHSTKHDDPREVRRIWAILADRFSPTPRDKSNYLLKIIDSSDPDATEIQLRQFFGTPDHPDALSLLFTSHIAENDVSAARAAFDRLMDVNPTLQSVNRMLGLYAANVDADPAVELFDQMAEYGLEPNIASYTSLISLFANTRDVENARNVFGLMEDSDILPDVAAYSAVLNAEVEAGEWTAASQRWIDIPPMYQTSPAIISVLLKAYLHLNIPTSRVLEIFRRVHTPTPYLWALAMQSAVDNDDMELAHELLLEMDDLAGAGARHPRPTVYHYSVLLHGYMRTGRRADARATYMHMLEKEIIPSSVTYGMIMSAFRRIDGQSGLDQATQFANSLNAAARQLSGVPRGRGTGRENLYGPLVSMAAGTGQLGLAQDYMDLASPDRPTIQLYTKIMDAYRQAGKTDAVLAIWDKAFDLACTVSRRTESNPSGGVATSRVRDNILCIPLSITLDALATAGRYTDVRRVWESVQAAGFGFDAQNYNHYSVALARTGDVDRAFSIVENVLLPRWDQVKQRRVAAIREMSFGLIPTAEPPAVDDVPAQPNPSRNNRRYEQRFGPSSILGHTSRNATIDPDLLRHWRPSDVLWRPSLLTLSVLEHAYSQLQDLNHSAWMALGASEEEGELDDGNAEGSQSLGKEEEGGEVRLRSFGGAAIRDVEGEVKKTTPRAVLFRLNRKYGKVVALVMFHRRQRSAKRREKFGL